MTAETVHDAVGLEERHVTAPGRRDRRGLALDTKATSLFPDYELANASPFKDAMTVRDLFAVTVRGGWD